MQYIDYKKDNERFLSYLRTRKLDSLKSATIEDIKSIFLTACDEFFSREITVSSFAVICSVLILEAYKKDINNEIVGVLDAAQDLNYQLKEDKQNYLAFIKEIMRYYYNNS